MLNILFFIESLSGGGAEKVLLNLVNAMDQNRFAITVQTLYPEKTAEQLVPGIRYRYCYPMKNRTNKLKMRLETALGLTYLLHIRDDYDIEIAYLECGSTKIIAGSTNKKALKLAWVHCDLTKKADDPTAFARETAKYYQKYDKVVCVSNTAQQSFRKLYSDVPDAVTVYNTVDDAKILQAASEYVPPYGANMQNLVCVGRLSAEKGVDRLLKVYLRLFQEGLAPHLWIVGDGPERNKLEQYVKAHGFNDFARFEGYQKNPYPYMNGADILVCPSLYEGFSTVITEGLILGKPIVTTDCSGMRELLGDSEYGLVTANDDEALYQGLRRMLTEPGLLEHYAGKAKMRGKSIRQEALVRKTEDFFLTEYAAKTERMNGR